MIDLEKARQLATDLRRYPTVALAEEAARVIQELAGIVKRLPMTADGVRVVPGMSLWYADGKPFYVGVVSNVSVMESGTSWLCIEAFRLYSTREAALAAQQGGEA